MPTINWILYDLYCAEWALTFPGSQLVSARFRNSFCQVILDAQVGNWNRKFISVHFFLNTISLGWKSVKYKYKWIGIISMLNHIVVKFKSWALSVFFNFSNNKKWCVCIFYQLNNLFLHQSYLKCPLPVKLTL